MVASKSISEPLELLTFRVIKLSTFESVRVELLIFLTASLKVSVILLATATPVDELVGLTVTVGKVVFASVPLPTVMVPPTNIQRLFVSHVPDELIVKLPSISI